MVNTFVTDDDPVQCAKNLDYRRLGKQRVEAKQILDILTEPVDPEDSTKAWRHHPAVLMWRGYTNGLKYYLNCMIEEWVHRGYNNNMDFEEYLPNISEKKKEELDPSGIKLPWWFTCRQFQLAHQCALLRKDDKYYQDVFKLTEEEKEQYFLLGYIWPSKLTLNERKLLRAGQLPNESFEALGTGVPAQYRISKDLVRKWLKDPLVNPATGRAIKAGAAIHKDYTKAAQFHGLM